MGLSLLDILLLVSLGFYCHFWVWGSRFIFLAMDGVYLGQVKSILISCAYVDSHMCIAL